jgi:hypothetical protein
MREQCSRALEHPANYEDDLASQIRVIDTQIKTE